MSEAISGFFFPHITDAHAGYGFPCCAGQDQPAWNVLPRKAKSAVETSCMASVSRFPLSFTSATRRLTRGDNGTAQVFVVAACPGAERKAGHDRGPESHGDNALDRFHVVELHH